MTWHGSIRRTTSSCTCAPSIYQQTRSFVDRNSLLIQLSLPHQEPHSLDNPELILLHASSIALYLGLGTSSTPRWTHHAASPRATYKSYLSVFHRVLPYWRPSSRSLSSIVVFSQTDICNWDLVRELELNVIKSANIHGAGLRERRSCQSPGV